MCDVIGNRLKECFMGRFAASIMIPILMALSVLPFHSHAEGFKPLLPADAIAVSYFNNAAAQRSADAKVIDGKLKSLAQQDAQRARKKPQKTDESGNISLLLGQNKPFLFIDPYLDVDAALALEGGKDVWTLSTVAGLIPPKQKGKAVCPDITHSICVPCNAEKSIEALAKALKPKATLKPESVGDISLWSLVPTDKKRFGGLTNLAPCVTFLDGNLILFASNRETLLNQVALYQGKAPAMDARAPMNAVFDLPENTLGRTLIPDVGGILTEHLTEEVKREIRTAFLFELPLRFDSVCELFIDLSVPPGRETLITTLQFSCKTEEDTRNMQDWGDIIKNMASAGWYAMAKKTPEYNVLLNLSEKMGGCVTGRTVTLTVPVSTQDMEGLSKLKDIQR